MEPEEFKTVNCVMTVPEAARFLGVGKKIVYGLLDNGMLDFTRVKGAVLIDCNSLSAFRSSGRLT
ncbi:MAG: helix-turn-helix domain-containing protein [Desulfobacterales bacterium]